MADLRGPGLPAYSLLVARGTEAGVEARLRDCATAWNLSPRVVEVLRGGIRATDNGSTNGTFCDGLRFTSLEVKPGAVLAMGRSELKLVPATVPVMVGATAGSVLTTVVVRSVVARRD